MHERQMQPLRTNPSKRGAKVTTLSVLLFYLATLPGAGVQGKPGKDRQRAWLPLAVVVGVEACVTLYTDWGEPPVSC